MKAGSHMCSTDVVVVVVVVVLSWSVVSVYKCD